MARRASPTTPEGVRVLRVDRDSAVLRVDGVARTLSLVVDHSGLGGGTEPGGTIMLAADPHGQFFTSGAINGRSVQFIVDTTGRAKPETIVCMQATYKDFALAAIDAVKMMEFTPATLEGHKIEQLVQYPIDFKLNAVLPVKPFEVPTRRPTRRPPGS